MGTLIRVKVLSTVTMILVVFSVPLPFTPAFCGVSLDRIPILMKYFTVKPVTKILMRLIGVLLGLILAKARATNIKRVTGFVVKYSFYMPTNLVCEEGEAEGDTLVKVMAKAILVVIVKYFIGTFMLLPACTTTFKVPVSTLINVKATIGSRVADLSAFIVFTMTPFGLIGKVIISLVMFLVCGGVDPVFEVEW